MNLFSIGEYIGGRYLVNDVRQGGLGVVYLCYDEFLQSHVALKTFQFKSNKEWKIALSSFIHEAKTWSTIEHSSNIVQAYYVYNLRTDDGVIPYLVMEAVQGHPKIGVTLADWIRNSVLDLKLIFLFAREISSGMVHVNKCLSIGDYNFVHRDLKPHNILISKEGSVKITDFGLAKIIHDNISKITSLSEYPPIKDGGYTFGFTKSLCGTPPYMSPEQCKGIKSIDQISDIYSFGCILYEMCTQRYIFQASSLEEFIFKHIHEQPVSVQSLNPDIPQSLSILIHTCLAKNPSERPQNFKQIRDYLAEAMVKEGYPSNMALRFWLFGFSSFTDEPRIKSDFNIKKEDEAIMLGHGGNVDYVISQGLVKDNDKYHKILSHYLNKSEEVRKIQLSQKKLIEKSEALLENGDSLLKLSESTEGQERIKLIEEAIYKYQTAQALKQSEAVIISFRIGLSYNALSIELQGEHGSLVNYFTQFAIEEFNFILKQKLSIAIMDIGATLYILPFHALFHRAISFLIREDIEAAKEDWGNLLTWIDKSDLSRFPNIAKELKQNTIDSLERWIK